MCYRDANASEADLYFLYVAQQITIYGNWPQIILGVILNSFSLLILLQSPSFRKVKSLPIFACKIFVDILDLLFNPLVWAIEASEPEFWQLTPDALCKVRYTLSTGAMLLEPYCIVLCSIDRFVAILFPLSYSSLVKRRRLVAALVGLSLSSFGFSLVHLVCVSSDSGCCSYASGFQAFWTDVRPFIVLVFGNAIPLVVIGVSNVITAVALWVQLRHRSRLARHPSTTSLPYSNVTVTLCVEGFCFVILCSPMVLANIFYKSEQPYVDPQHVLAFRLGGVFYTLSRSINFFILMCCIRRFRRRVQYLCCQCKNAVESQAEPT